MCTVSYISQKGGGFITSNRDEHISRPGALEPQVELVNSVKVLFPKDAQAGGTWFAVNEFGSVAVLLNGAFENHERKLPYAKSRGLVLLEVTGNQQPQKVLKGMDLTQIEPFTLVLFDGDELVEFRWDGTLKHWKDLDTNQNYIWSSVTLYSEQAIAQRTSLFETFTNSGAGITASKIVDFHSNNHEDFENGFIIDRSSGLKTFSVTQVVLDPDGFCMKHFDLLNNKNYKVPFSPTILAMAK